jgi:LysM repeat protein/ABC-type branched-subunit amino acid transport system substrate-binding protein
LKATQVLLFICFSLGLFAQNTPKTDIVKSTKIEKIDGQKYYMHTVEAGQTVYSIAKAYDVNPKDVIFENPEVVDGVSLNQVLKIPLKETKKATAVEPPKTVKTTAPSYLTHTVEKKQTLYAISKLYNLSPEEITAANPEVEAGLKIGQVLKIPVKGTEAKVEEKQEELIPVVESKLQESPKSLTVALLVPFNTDELDSVKFQKNTRTAIPQKSYAAIEFYEGLLLAADSLSKSGLDLKLMVYDTPNDSLRTERLLEKAELRKTDLIIGPFHNVPAEIVAKYAKRNRIPNIIPFAQQNKLLLGNKYAIKVSASTSTQIEAVSAFITKNYKHQNVLVLHNALVKEKSSVQVFKQKTNLELGKDSVKEVIFKTEGAKGLQNKLSLTSDNIIFVPSNDQAFVTSLVNSLRGLKKTYKIILFGMESWVSFDNLDINTIQDLDLHLPASSSINYEDAASIEMMKKYRAKYKTDPSKYAFQGYDCGLYFLSSLQKFGKDFYLSLPDTKAKGLQTNFQFIETAVESGYENKSVFILQYKDFSLSPVK